MIQCDVNGKNKGYVNGEAGVARVLEDALGRQPTPEELSDAMRHKTLTINGDTYLFIQDAPYH